MTVAVPGEVDDSSGGAHRVMGVRFLPIQSRSFKSAKTSAAPDCT